MKRRIIALVMTLCMVLTMTPVHVHAEDHVHEFSSAWHATQEYHYHQCMNADCPLSHEETEGYGLHDFSLYPERCSVCSYVLPDHEHYGGTATCVWRADCEGCGGEYGETDPDNHNDRFGEDNGDGTHTSMCSCDHVYDPAEAHIYSEWIDNENGTESRYCTECFISEMRTIHTHSFTSAWTVREDVHWRDCIAVGDCNERESYGEHVWDEFYTIRCSVCYYTKEHNHTGGKATCQRQATCELCGLLYGDTDPNNHQGRTGEFIDADAHKVTCFGCGELLLESEPHDFTDWYDNGDGTLGRFCNLCRYEESKMDHIHVWEWTNNDSMHWQKCNGCGESSSAAEMHLFDDDSDALCDKCGYTREESQQAFVITTEGMAEGVVGEAYSQLFAYEGTLSGVMFWNATGLPEGLSIDVSTGTVSGTPKAAGDYKVTVSLGATGGGSASKEYTLSVIHPQAFKITTEGMAEGVVGEAYSQSFAYEGTPSGIVFWNATGLPEGLSIDVSTGTVSGTPKAAGSYPVTISLGATGGGSGTKNFTLVVKEHEHLWNTEWETDAESHWHACMTEGCAVISEKQAHDMTAANCHLPASCSVCGLIVGEADKMNHVGGTRIENQIPSTDVDDGYTGDTYCEGCGDLLQKGEAVPNLTGHVHKLDVNATCAEEGKCTCGKVMTDKDMNNHVGEIEIRDTFPAEEFKPGYTGDAYCLACGEIVEKGEEIPQTHVHILSISDCVSPGGCSCGYNYTPINPNQHLADRTIVNAKEATKTEHGYTGDEICSACRIVFTAGKVIHNVTVKYNDNGHWYECDIPDCPDFDALKTERESHYTMSNDGVCDVCEQKFHWHMWSNTLEYDEKAHYKQCFAENCFLSKELYPQYAEHAPENVRYIDGETHALECSVCDYSGTSSHRDQDPVYADETHHWYLCLANAQIVLKEDHIWNHDESDNPGPTDCAVCGVKFNDIKFGCSHETTLQCQSDEYHQPRCSKCNMFVDDTEKHNFKIVNTGVAGHSEECADCGYARTPVQHGNYKKDRNNQHHWLKCGSCSYTTPKQPHMLEDCKKKDKEVHKGYCAYCNASFEAGHNFVTKAGSYDGERCILVCDSCDATADASHQFELRSYALGHAMSCECGQVDGEFVRHSGEGVMVQGYDESGHYDYCPVCKYQAQTRPHTFNYQSVFERTHDKTCADCEYGCREACTGSGDFLYDELSHWKICDHCGSDAATGSWFHTDENLDEKCDICPAEVIHKHEYEWTWINNERHSGKCTVTGCNHIVNAQHVRGDMPIFCGDCGGEMTYKAETGKADWIISFTTDVEGGASSLEDKPIAGDYGQLGKLFENVNFEPVTQEGDDSNGTPGAEDGLLGTVTGGEKDVYVGGAQIGAGQTYSLYNAFSRLIDVNNGEDVPGTMMIQRYLTGFEGNDGIQIIAIHDTNQDSMLAKLWEISYEITRVKAELLNVDGNDNAGREQLEKKLEELMNQYAELEKLLDDSGMDLDFDFEFGYASVTDGLMTALFEVDTQSPFLILVLVPTA